MNEKNKPDDDGKQSDGDKSKINIKFKPINLPLKVRENIPIDFWKNENQEATNDDEPLILEIHDAHEGEAERGKCIVCYKGIYESDTDVFKCPNCGREAHYLCATIFLTEHGICPVCSTKLILDKLTGKYVAVEHDKNNH